MRLLPGPGTTRRIWLVACALAWGGALLAASHAWQLSTRVDASAAGLEVGRTALPPAPVSTANPKSEVFVDHLPAAGDLAAQSDLLLRTLQRSTSQRQVRLISMSHQIHAPTASTLARAEIALVLQGGYAQVKASIADALERLPHAIVQRLAIGPAAQGQGVEARLDLVCAARPETATGQ